MKKLFVFATALVFSFALMALTSAQDSPVRPAAEKTCADWQAAGLCPVQWRCAQWLADGTCPRDTEGVRCRQLIEEGRCPVRWTCSEIQERGRCPLVNARAEAQRTEAATENTEPPRRQCARAQGQPCCGRHRGAAAEATVVETAEEAPRRRGRRAGTR